MDRNEELFIFENYIGRDVKSIRALDMGRTTYLMQELARKDTLVTPDTVQIVANNGYDWRNQGALDMVSPETAVYLDCLARQNELTKSGSFAQAENRLVELTMEGVLE